MIIETVLIALVATIGYGEYFLTGRGQVSRPIIMGPLTGLIMGDLTTGIMIGASLELTYIGVQEVGASIPQDLVSAGILGTAFAISTGKGISAGLTFGLPISMLVLLVQNMFYIFVSPLYVAKCDQYAAEGESKKLSNMAFWGGTIVNFVPSILIVALCYYFGNEVSQNIVEAIPMFVQDGLVIASGILPAFGFAMLLQTTMKKKTIPFFILGFLLSAYLELPIIGISLFGLVIVLVMQFYGKTNVEVDLDEEF
ncbi:PTS sugar transporter subunit IIC [Erysipelothrix urinaevulpis]|uniref:PTS mannose/fructose/sorbose/N-acetylgalactosamine transporter subunit IIC n=1 Tax=Erysipelothrix urinaevulpis TaxID=2683717 RepID=UPI001358ACBC|nr:PTS sugar transporter subunit IIC [Erysipelothrix urinaevulpis]